jgi:Transposase DDE domain
MTDNSVGDAPMPELLGQIPPDEALASVSADVAYDTKACHAAITERSAQSLIPPRKNAQRWKVTLVGASMCNEAHRTCQRQGWRIWKKWRGYQRRSLVETKMHCFKRLGERVMARKFEHQVVELHVRMTVLTRFTQLGAVTAMA